MQCQIARLEGVGTRCDLFVCIQRSRARTAMLLYRAFVVYSFCVFVAAIGNPLGLLILEKKSSYFLQIFLSFFWVESKWVYHYLGVNHEFYVDIC